MNTIKIFGLPGVSRLGEVGDKGEPGINVYYGDKLIPKVTGYSSLYELINVDIPLDTNYGFRYTDESGEYYSEKIIQIVESDSLQVDSYGVENITKYDLLIDTRTSNPKIYKIYVYNNTEKNYHRLVFSEIPFDDMKISIMPIIEYSTSYGLIDNQSTSVKLYQTLNSEIDEEYIYIYVTIDNFNTKHMVKNFGEKLESSIIISFDEGVNLFEKNGNHTLYFFAVYKVNEFKLKTKFLTKVVIK